MIDGLKNMLNFPLIQQGEFALTLFNLVVFAIIFLCGRLFIAYIKKYFAAKDLTKKQLTIEGKEIAIWKLTKQVIYFILAYICFLSLRLNNTNLDFEHILEFEFIRFKSFHVAVYHIFVIIAVLFASRIALNFLKVFLLKAVQRNPNIDKGTEYVYLQLAKYFIYTLAAVIIIRSFGVGLTMFMTGAAALLVGIGFGLQNIFGQYMSGILLLFEGAVKVGDIIEIQNGNGQENFVAKIIKINLRTSKIETRDGVMLIVPNNKLTNESVNNWTNESSLTRFTVKVSVAYGTDLELVKEILKRCAEAHQNVSDQREVIVRLLNFGNDGIEMDVVFWAEQTFYIEIHKSDIRFAIEREFKKYGIVIPFRQVVVHQNPTVGGGAESVL